MAAYDYVSINGKTVEFLIPITIFITAVYNIFSLGKNKKINKERILFFSALIFGIVHGLGFAREFTMVFGDAENKLLALLEFALGIEIAQMIVVLIILFLGHVFQNIFRFSKRDWVLVLSSIVIGLVIPILIENDILFS